MHMFVFMWTPNAHRVALGTSFGILVPCASTFVSARTTCGGMDARGVLPLHGCCWQALDFAERFDGFRSTAERFRKFARRWFSRFADFRL